MNKDKVRKKQTNSVRTILLICVDNEIHKILKLKRQMKINGHHPITIFKHFTEMNNTITFTNPLTTYSTYNNNGNECNSNNSSSYSLFQNRKNISTKLLRKLSQKEGEMAFNKKVHVSQLKLRLYSKPSSYEFDYNDSMEKEDNEKQHKLYIKCCKYLINLAESLFPNAPYVKGDNDGEVFTFRQDCNDNGKGISSGNISLSQEEQEDYFATYKKEFDLIPKEFQFKYGDNVSGSGSNSSMVILHFDSCSSFNM